MIIENKQTSSLETVQLDHQGSTIEVVALSILEMIAYAYEWLLLSLIVCMRNQSQADALFEGADKIIYSDNCLRHEDIRRYVQSKSVDLDDYAFTAKKYSLQNKKEHGALEANGLCLGGAIHLFETIHKNKVPLGEAFDKCEGGISYEAARYQAIHNHFHHMIHRDMSSFLIAFIDAYLVAEEPGITYEDYLVAWKEKFIIADILKAVKTVIDTDRDKIRKTNFAQEVLDHLKDYAISPNIRGCLIQTSEHFGQKNYQVLDEIGFVCSVAGLETLSLVCDESPDQVLSTLSGLDQGTYLMTLDCYYPFGKHYGDGHVMVFTIDTDGTTYFHDCNFGVGVFDTKEKAIKSVERAFTFYTGLQFSEGKAVPITLTQWLCNLFTLSSNPPLHETIGSGFTLIKVTEESL